MVGDMGALYPDCVLLSLSALHSATCQTRAWAGRAAVHDAPLATTLLRENPFEVVKDLKPTLEALHSLSFRALLIA